MLNKSKTLENKIKNLTKKKRFEIALKWSISKNVSGKKTLVIKATIEKRRVPGVVSFDLQLIVRGAVCVYGHTIVYGISQLFLGHLSTSSFFFRQALNIK
jgi:hypothetical protein